MARDGMSALEADRMLAAQATPSERRAIANDVIENDGELQSLAAQVEALHARYLALGSSMGDT
jgi:dephospho-CoA kinase